MKALSKDDRRAVFILLAVIIVCFILFPFVDRLVDTGGEKAKDSVSVASRDTSAKGDNTYYAVEEKEYELFPFDPNTADSTQFLRLGLRPWQVRNIYKYRAAGGRYRKATDFARLYGLTLKQYKRLEPYITIEKEVMAADVYGKESAPDVHEKDISSRDSSVSVAVAKTSASSSAKSVSGYPKKIKAGEKIDVNTADTTSLQTIPGIGPYFARQIVHHRERLGGIAAVSQLREIEGFPESSLPYIIVSSSSSVKKVKINTLDAWKLSRHPYILYVQAKDIVAYRQQHGSITSSSQLESLKTFTPSDVKRLTPYLDFSR